jgi:uncharacterized protein (DUF952 family)
VRLIYKILSAAEWQAAKTAGRFAGSAVDLADGYIHFSTGAQAQGTARRHFAGQEGLVLLKVNADLLGEALRWEPSRDGELFPHLHGSLPTHLVIDARSLGSRDGAPDLGGLA